MRKCFCLLGVLICCMLFAIPAQADMIWEPDDNFYNSHASECTYINRAFIANGPDDVVIIYKSPESPQVIKQLKNGVKTYISYTYEDSNGVLWGIYEDFEHKKTGWMPMDYMEVVYDSISFAEEFAADIVTQDGVIDDAYFNQEIYLWNYPGAEESYKMETNEWLPAYSRVFTDEVGHSWGNIGYYYGMKNCWICIDQPAADFDTLYPDGAPQRGKTQADNAQQTTVGENRIVPKQNPTIVMITIILVLAVVLVTAGLLATLRKK